MDSPDAGTNKQDGVSITTRSDDDVNALKIRAEKFAKDLPPSVCDRPLLTTGAAAAEARTPQTKKWPALPAAPLLASAALLSGCDGGTGVVLAGSTGYLLGAFLLSVFNITMNERSAWLKKTSGTAYFAALAANTLLFAAGAAHGQALHGALGGWAVAAGVASLISGAFAPQWAYLGEIALPEAIRNRKAKADAERLEAIRGQADVTAKDGFAALKNLFQRPDEVRAAILDKLSSQEFKQEIAKLTPGETAALGREIDWLLAKAPHLFADSALSQLLEGVRRVAVSLENQDPFRWIIATLPLAENARAAGPASVAALNRLHASIFARSKGERREAVLDTLVEEIAKLLPEAKKHPDYAAAKKLGALLGVAENLVPLMDATEKKRLAAPLAEFTESPNASRLLPLLLGESDLALGGASEAYVRRLLKQNKSELPETVFTGDDTATVPAETFAARVFPAIFDSANKPHWRDFQPQMVPLLLTRRDLVDPFLDGLCAGLENPSYDARVFAAQTLTLLAAEPGLLADPQKKKLAERVAALEETLKPELKMQTRAVAQSLRERGILAARAAAAATVKS